MVGRAIRCPFDVTAAASTTYGVWLGGSTANIAGSIATEGTGATQDHDSGLFTNSSILALLGVGSKIPRGRLMRCGLRLHSGGGWTFSELRLRIAVMDMSRAFGALNPDPNQCESHLLLYDSGVLTPATTPAIAASSDTAFLDYVFGPDGFPPSFGSPLFVGLAWATSAGAGTSQLTAHMHVEEWDA